MKKLIIPATLILAALTSFAFKSIKEEKVIMIVSLEVENFTEWKKGFDAGASVREKAGIKVLSICNSVENKNKIVVIEEAESAQTSYDFIAMLKSRQKPNHPQLDIQLFDKVD